MNDVSNQSIDRVVRAAASFVAQIFAVKYAIRPALMMHIIYNGFLTWSSLSPLLSPSIFLHFFKFVHAVLSVIQCSIVVTLYARTVLVANLAFAMYY